MRRIAVVLVLAASAGCNGSKPITPPPPPGASVTLRRNSVGVNHLVRDPDRRYPRGPGILCSWDRDRFLHFFSDSPEFRDVVFLDSAAGVVELDKLAASSDVGLTSKSEARHALFLTAGAIQKDGLQVGDKVAFSPAIVAAKIDPMPVIKVGGHTVHVETSHRIEQRQCGLMHRPRMSKNDGMLFLYGMADTRSFWMLNTHIPLDIAYFDDGGRLLNVCRMKPAADPAKGGELKAPSAAPARFVLELNYGWFDARGLIDADGKPKVDVRMELPDSVRKLADEAE